MAEFAFTDGAIPSAANWNANVRDQLTIICTSSTRPGSPTTGRRIYETDTGKEYVYTGAAWTLCGDNAAYGVWSTYTPSWKASSDPAIGNGTLTGAYLLVGKTLYLRISLIANTTTTFGSGQWYFSLPLSLTAVGISTAVGRMRIGASGNYWGFQLYSSTGSNSVFTTCESSSTNNTLTVVAATTPDTWTATTSNELYVSMVLQVN